MADSIQDALQAIESRHEDDAETLSIRIQENFSGSLLSLRQLEPLIREILRRFKRLPRKAGVDGKFATIAGHRSFGPGKVDKVGWCQGKLKRSDRTVRYMLSGGNRKRKEPRVETVSSLDAATVLKTLDRNIGRLDANQQKILAHALPAVLSRLIGELKNG